MTTTTSKTPSHYIYAVTKREGSEKGHWTQIGAAWPNADGKGFNIDLALVPLNGATISMRVPKEEGAAQ